MQINARTFQGLQQQYQILHNRQLADPATNILAGALYLRNMYDQFHHNWEAALRAYNSGPNNVNLADLNQALNGTDPHYVARVMQIWNAISNGGEVPN